MSMSRTNKYLILATLTLAWFAYEISAASDLGLVFVIWLLFHTLHIYLGVLVIRHFMTRSNPIINLLYKITDWYSDHYSWPFAETIVFTWWQWLHDKRRRKEYENIV